MESPVTINPSSLPGKGGGLPQKWKGVFSGSNTKLNTDGQLYLIIFYTSQGSQINFQIGCNEHPSSLTNQRTLFLSFAINNCYPTSDEKLLEPFELILGDFLPLENPIKYVSFDLFGGFLNVHHR
jgi:hypothetical protein